MSRLGTFAAVICFLSLLSLLLVYVVLNSNLEEGQLTSAHSGHNEVKVDYQSTSTATSAQSGTSKWALLPGELESGRGDGGNNNAPDETTADEEGRKMILTMRRTVLGVIEVFFDRDRDGLLNSHELSMWIVKVQEQLIDHQVRIQFPFFLDHGAAEVTYENIMKSFDKMNDSVNYTRNHRRFQLADSNRDRSLDIVEFRQFMYPDENVLVDEVIESLDTDLDDQLSLEEMTAIMPLDQAKLLDLNNDGLLSLDEIKIWILPPVFYIPDQVDALLACDTNFDRCLNKEEVDANYDKFIPLLPVDPHTFHLYMDDSLLNNEPKENHHRHSTPSYEDEYEDEGSDSDSLVATDAGMHRSSDEL